LPLFCVLALEKALSRAGASRVVACGVGRDAAPVLGCAVGRDAAPVLGCAVGRDAAPVLADRSVAAGRAALS